MVKEFKYSQKDFEEDEPVSKATVTSKEDEKEIKQIQAKIEKGKPVLAREEAKAKGKIAKMANWE